MGWIDENEKMEEHREIRWMTRMERKLGKKIKSSMMTRIAWSRRLNVHNIHTKTLSKLVRGFFWPFFFFFLNDEAEGEESKDS